MIRVQIKLGPVVLSVKSTKIGIIKTRKDPETHMLQIKFDLKFKKYSRLSHPISLLLLLFPNKRT